MDKKQQNMFEKMAQTITQNLRNHDTESIKKLLDSNKCLCKNDIKKVDDLLKDFIKLDPRTGNSE